MKCTAVLSFTALSMLLAGCSFGGDSSELTDRQLATEYSRTVYGQSLDDAAGGPEVAERTIVDRVTDHCAVLGDMMDTGLISTDPEYSTNGSGLAALEARLAKELNFTARQARDALGISARYRCDEFTPMLRAYDAAGMVG